MLLITTGGTIDSHRDTKQQMIAPLRHTLVPEVLHRLGLTYDEHNALCTKDARDLDRNDLDRLLHIIQTTDHDRIIITHGYQTMTDSMRLLSPREHEKTIVCVDTLTPASEDPLLAQGQLQAAREIDEKGIYALRNRQPITRDELQQLQYAGEVQSEWCF